MKLIIILLAAVAAVSAHDPNEGVPDMRKDCVCPEPILPPFLNDKAVGTAKSPSLRLIMSQKCEFLASHALSCYKRSNGGCPEPSAKVSKSGD